MKRGLAPLAIVLAGVTGCSLPLWLLPDVDESFTEQPEVGPIRDSGLLPRRDTGVDTSPQPDTFVSRDTAPPVCDLPLPDGFSCDSPAPKASASVCTDAMLSELFDACFDPSTSSSVKCGAAEAKYPQCAKCTLGTWLDDHGVFDTAACILAVDPGNRCADAWRCSTDCLFLVCSECAGTEQEECFSRAQRSSPLGACYDSGVREFSECSKQPRIAPCYVTGPADVIPFWRGACRDDGHWAAAADAGPDASDTD